MCALVFTKSMVIGVKSCICTHFLLDPNNYEKYQLIYFKQNTETPKCPTFVDMPHGFSFDIEELLYYRVSYGDTWMERKEKCSLLPTENEVREWEAHQPMKLLLHFKNGTELEIPDFEMKFLEKWFFPAIRQLEENTW